jgi:hypothetical protein
MHDDSSAGGQAESAARSTRVVAFVWHITVTNEFGASAESDGQK